MSTIPIGRSSTAAEFTRDLDDDARNRASRATPATNFDYNWKGAAETLRKALTLAPEDPASLMEMGNLAGIRGDVTRAQEFLRHAVTVDPVNAHARVQYGGVRAFRGSALGIQAGDRVTPPDLRINASCSLSAIWTFVR